MKLFHGEEGRVHHHEYAYDEQIGSPDARTGRFLARKKCECGASLGDYWDSVF